MQCCVHGHQEVKDDQTKHGTAAKAASCDIQHLWEGRTGGQTRWIQDSKLLSLLLVNEVGGHCGVFPLLQKLVIEILRTLVIASQLLKLKFNHGTGFDV